ncbi:hypothetical protein NXY41_09710 [Bacteroides fragilis]|nr:hypothetical protein [Bacteroides fragilis]MCS2878868.1 hypothetical protein [Bacteroides fragilis]
MEGTDRYDGCLVSRLQQTGLCSSKGTTVSRGCFRSRTDKNGCKLIGRQSYPYRKGKEGKETGKMVGNGPVP